MGKPWRLLCLTVLCSALTVGAQVPDPTRPAGQPIESGVQTVILRAEGKSAAVIYGEYVEVGGRVGDKRVVGITENAITLVGDKGVEVIKTMSSVRKVATPKGPTGKRSVGQDVDMKEKVH